MGFQNRTAPSDSVGFGQEDDLQFSAFILLADDLKFEGRDIVAALRDEFPDMIWGGDTFDDLMGTQPQSTSDAVMYRMGLGPDVKPALIKNMPGFDFIPPREMMTGRMPPAEIERIVGGSRSYLNVAVWAPRADRALRVEALRRLAAICTVFAQRPEARAVTWHPANRVAPAAAFAGCAQDIRAGDHPFLQTILPLLGCDPDRPDTNTARTYGFWAAIDAEIEVIQSPMPPAETMMLAMGAGKMAAQLGHAFQDGDTMGPDVGASGVPTCRIRHAPADLHPTGRAHWVLVPAGSPFDHVAAYGVPPKRSGRRSQTSETGWLARQLTRGPIQ